MSLSDTIDLSRLPPPAVVEVLDYEAILAQRKARLLELLPAEQRMALATVLDLDSEPATIQLQENSYRELVLRHRINQAARSVMLATATGTDLDALVALLGVGRMQIAQDVFESDDDLRRRAQLSLEGTTSAGSRGSYQFHALSAHPDVADVYVDSPTPGEVRLYVLSRRGNGTPSAQVLQAVYDSVSAEDVRPLSDFVSVVGAELVSFDVAASLFVQTGPAPSAVLESARAALQAFLDRPRRIGASVAISAIYSELHQPGVVRVDMTRPTTDIECAPHQAAYCKAIDLRAEVA